METCQVAAENPGTMILIVTVHHRKRVLGQVVVHRRSPQDVAIAAAAKKPRFEQSENESRPVNKNAMYSLAEMRHKTKVGEPLDAKETLYMDRVSSQTEWSIVLSPH